MAQVLHLFVSVQTIMGPQALPSSVMIVVTVNCFLVWPQRLLVFTALHVSVMMQRK